MDKNNCPFSIFRLKNRKKTLKICFGLISSKFNFGIFHFVTEKKNFKILKIPKKNPSSTFVLYLERFIERFFF